MIDLAGAAIEIAGLLPAEAGRGETIEVRTPRVRRRKHLLTAGAARSAEPVAVPSPSLVRHARGQREAYLWVDDLSRATAAESLAAVRDMHAYGCPYGEADVLHPEGRWDERHVDDRLADPAAPLSALWQEIGDTTSAVGDTLSALGDTAVALSVSEALLTEEQVAEAFVRSTGDVRSFRLTRLTARLLVEVRAGGRRARLYTACHGGRVDALPLADAVAEAAMRGAVMLARPGEDLSGEDPSGGLPLLLTPRTTAAFLRVVAAGLLDPAIRPDVKVAPNCRVVDDAHAVGGPHARPYDHEGSPTGRTVLLDADGRRPEVTTRSGPPPAGRARARLTGNAYAAAALGAPAPRPTNVRLEGSSAYPGSQGFSGLLGYNLRGAGTQHIRTGPHLRFRVETARMRDGVVTGRAPDLFLAGTVAQLVEAVDSASAATHHVAWTDFSTAAAWAIIADPGRLAEIG